MLPASALPADAIWARHPYITVTASVGTNQPVSGIVPEICPAILAEPMSSGEISVEWSVLVPEPGMRGQDAL